MIYIHKHVVVVTVGLLPLGTLRQPRSSSATTSKLEGVSSSAGLASVQPEPKTTVSPGQIACLLTYAGFLALWAYAELIEFTRHVATSVRHAHVTCFMSHSGGPAGVAGGPLHLMKNLDHIRNRRLSCSRLELAKLSCSCSQPIAKKLCRTQA